MKHEPQEPVGRGPDSPGVSHVARHARDREWWGGGTVAPLDIGQAAEEAPAEELANW
jgi:hypothetical protein